MSRNLNQTAKLAMSLAVGLVVAAGIESGRADDTLDKKVVELVKQTGDYYKNAKSFHVEATIVTKTEGGEKKDMEVGAVFDIERPNFFRLKTQLNGDAKKGPDIVADGKKLTVLAKARNEFIQGDSPETLGEIGLKMLQMGPASTGMLFANVLVDDPADLLMQGVNSCSYVGKDKVDGAAVHRMKFSQDQFDWELWVAAEGKPLVLRMVRIVNGDNGKITTTETYKNWKVDPEIAKETFTFTAPKDAVKVDEFGEKPGR